MTHSVQMPDIFARLFVFKTLVLIYFSLTTRNFLFQPVIAIFHLFKKLSISKTCTPHTKSSFSSIDTSTRSIFFLFFTLQYSCLTNFISELSTWKYCNGAFRRNIFYEQCYVSLDVKLRKTRVSLKK